MGQFSFDETKTFDENLDMYILFMDSVDEEMSRLFRKHIDRLKGAKDDIQRNAAREDFNAKIESELRKFDADRKSKTATL